MLACRAWPAVDCWWLAAHGRQPTVGCGLSASARKALVTEIETLNGEVRGCQRCRLAQTRKLAVPGEGSERADLLFIGEAPGFWENEQGRPFVGPAGQLLDELLALIGVKRATVYISNVVKCRPPGNREPLPDEIAACAGYLDRLIAALKPKVVVTLGRYSMARFFPPGKSMKELHGKVVWRDGMACVAMYHPAAVLRQASLRPVIEADFRTIPGILAQAKAGAAQQEQAEAEQLSLF
ncbi:MAG: uracil-DNA glycosylase [Chloroflexi bacterium]|nr:uracil-DNA glycosylase [Chloroflexota bacterium]